MVEPLPLYAASGTREIGNFSRSGYLGKPTLVFLVIHELNSRERTPRFQGASMGDHSALPGDAAVATPAAQKATEYSTVAGFDVLHGKGYVGHLVPNPLDSRLPPHVEGVATGYAYQTAHVIGNAGGVVTAENAMRILQTVPNKIFPFAIVLEHAGHGAATISDGALLDLQNVRFPGDTGNLVTVEHTTPTQFTFKTLPGHFDGAGALISFRTYEIDGKVYLEQTAWAPHAGFNTNMAPHGATTWTWPHQAQNLHDQLLNPDTPLHFPFVGEGIAASGAGSQPVVVHPDDKGHSLDKPTVESSHTSTDGSSTHSDVGAGVMTIGPISVEPGDGSHQSGTHSDIGAGVMTIGPISVEPGDGSHQPETHSDVGAGVMTIGPISVEPGDGSHQPETHSDVGAGVMTIGPISVEPGDGSHQSETHSDIGAGVMTIGPISVEPGDGSHQPGTHSDIGAGVITTGLILSGDGGVTDQGHTAGTGSDQGHTAGTGSDQGHTAGTGSNQGHTPGPGSDQGQTPGIDRGHAPASDGGHAHGNAPNSDHGGSSSFDHSGSSGFDHGGDPSGHHGGG
jgi:hypothetical protein